MLPFGAVAQVTTPATNLPVVGPPAILAPAEAKPPERPDKKQFSHALGIYYAQGVTNDMVRGKAGLDPKTDLDLGVFIETFSNVVVGVPMGTNMEELRQILKAENDYQTNRIAQEIEKLKTTGPENKVKGEKFMEEIAKTPGVTKLASGVVYKVIKDGDGDKPLSVDVGTLSFRASTVDGKEVWKIEHTPVLVNHQLLPTGMKEALLMMKAGSHWTLYLPYTQAYGEQPGIADPKHGFMVGPCSALILDVELESVQHRPSPPPMQMPPGMQPPAMAPTAPPPMPPRASAPPSGATAPAPVPAASLPVTSSSIVRVPSAVEMERGEKPRVLTDAEIEAAKAEAAAEAAKQAQTNSPAPK